MASTEERIINIERQLADSKTGGELDYVESYNVDKQHILFDPASGKMVRMSGSAFPLENGKSHPSRAAAMAVTPLPADNVIFSVDKYLPGTTTPNPEAGVYAYDSSDEDGNRKIKDFDDIQLPISLTDKFPYKSYVDIKKIVPFVKVVLDAIIENPQSGFVYSIGHIQTNLTTGLRELRVYRSSNGGLTNTLILSKSYYTTGPNVYTGNGVEYSEDVLSSGGETIKLLLNITELLKINSNITSVYANEYPLHPLVFSGGNGRIKSKVDLDSYITSKWNMFPYGTPSNKSLMYIENAIKSIDIFGSDPNRFYFLTSISNAAGFVEILVQSSSDVERTLDILNAIRLRIEPRGNYKGIQTHSGAGSNFASRVNITINWDFLNQTIGQSLTGSTTKFLPTKINFIDGFASKIAQLQHVSYDVETTLDGCATNEFKTKTRGLQVFHELQSNGNYSRANANGSVVVDEDGEYNVMLALFQPPSENPDADGINSYLSNVKFPKLSPSLPESININFADAGNLDFKHPEIIDLTTNPIGGYRYWLTTSTHPYQQDAWEDESIYVSNDFNSWLRVRAFNETYIAGTHAVGIAMPPHNLVNTSVNSWNQFLPIPRTGQTITVNGQSKTIASFLKHDPIFTFDRENGYLYWILSYNFKFTDDLTPGSAAQSNKFQVCIRTNDGVNYEIVRTDGSVLPISNSDVPNQMFTQNGVKNNYLRWIDHGLNEIGGSIVFFNNKWICFHGINGSLIYEGTKVYNVYNSTPIAGTGDSINHPGHFVYNSKLYRWGARGISEMNSDYSFTLFPINSMFNGFKGEESQYKKCIYVNSEGKAVFAVAENQEGFRNIISMPNSYALGKRGHLTIGKIENVQQMIDAAQAVKKGYYISVEAFITDKIVTKFRVPFLDKINFSNNHPIVRKYLVEKLPLKAGQVINFDVTSIHYGNLKTAVSNIYLIKT